MNAPHRTNTELNSRLDCQVVDEKRKITASCKLMIETDALMSELDHQEYCVAWRRAWSGKSTFIDFIVRFSVAFRKLI